MKSAMVGKAAAKAALAALMFADISFSYAQCPGPDCPPSPQKADRSEALLEAARPKKPEPKCPGVDCPDEPRPDILRSSSPAKSSSAVDKNSRPGRECPGPGCPR